jgi:hypothetical protein
MTRAGDIAGLGNLSGLVLDHRLSILREAAVRRDQSIAQIAALNLQTETTDLPPVEAGQVAFRYQLWADARRAELNSLLSRQTADWLAAREEAKLAFGRAEALKGLVGRVRHEK